MNTNILFELQEISDSLVTKEENYLGRYNEVAPEEVIKQVFEYMHSITVKVCEYKFMEKMGQMIFKDAITKIGINQILNEIDTLTKYVEENYYFDVSTCVKAFFKELIEDKVMLNSNPDYTLFTTKIQFYMYRISIGYSANIKVKNHPEYSKIKDLVECRENIIRFFHHKIKAEDYIYDELEMLKNLLIEYDKHMDDVKRLEDKNLKRILFQKFYTNYSNKLEVLFLINDL